MKKYFWMTILLTCFLCVGCGKGDEADGEVIESADAIEERLGIKMGMAEDVEGATDFQYSIIDDEIGQVRFIYNEDIIFFKASKTKTLEEMGVMIDQNGSFMASTIDGDIEEGTYTSVGFADMVDGGSIVEWRWSGIQFVIIMPFDTSIPQKSWFAERIAYNSYQ